MKTIILININKDPGELVSDLVNKLSIHKRRSNCLILDNILLLYYATEYCMKSEKLETYLGDLLAKMKRIKVDNGIFITNKDLSLERNFSEINQFKNQNNIKIITLK